MLMLGIRVEYFAALREHAGCGQERLQTTARTPRELFAELARRHAFPELGPMKVAVNDEFGDWEAPLSDGDSVVFIPPVAGG